MEPFQYQVAAFLSDAFFPRPEQYHTSGKTGSRSPAIVSSRFLRVYSNIVDRKLDAITWFHIASNGNLILLLTMSICFDIAATLLPVFYLVCLINGWTFFFTFEKMIGRFYHAILKKSRGQGKKVLLYQVAGQNFLSRSVLLGILIVSLCCAVTIHLSFIIITGLILRWVIECQARAFIGSINGFDQDMKANRKTGRSIITSVFEP